MIFIFKQLIKQDEYWAQLASTNKVILERADALCGKQRKSSKERTITGPNQRNSPVIDNEGMGEQVCKYRSMAFYGSSAFAI